MADFKQGKEMMAVCCIHYHYRPFNTSVSWSAPSLKIVPVTSYLPHVDFTPRGFDLGLCQTDGFILWCQCWQDMYRWSTKKKEVLDVWKCLFSGGVHEAVHEAHENLYPLPYAPGVIGRKMFLFKLCVPLCKLCQASL